MVLVHQIPVEFRREKLGLSTHVLRKPIEYPEYDLQTPVDLLPQRFLNVLARAGKSAVTKGLVQIDVYLLKIIVFPHLLQVLVQEIDKNRKFYHICPKPHKRHISHKLELLRHLAEMVHQLLLSQQIISSLLILRQSHETRKHGIDQIIIDAGKLYHIIMIMLIFDVRLAIQVLAHLVEEFLAFIVTNI